MSDSVTLTFRGLVLEDFMVAPAMGMTTAPVLGAGVVPVTPLVGAISDATAAAAGVPVGGVYMNTSNPSLIYLATRLT